MNGFDDDYESDTDWELEAKVIPPKGKKTTMSICEMGRVLGLKKTDSYWLAHKNNFDIIEINGEMRVVIKSFEEWYANQVKYRKVNGPPPGKTLQENTFSVQEACEVLEVKSDTVYTLIRKKAFKVIMVDSWMRIPKQSFWKWYSGQSRYRTAEDRVKDAALEEATISAPEVGRLLGVSRGTVCNIFDSPKNKGALEIVRMAGHRRVTKKSFYKWLAGQDRYSIVGEKKELSHPRAKNPNYYSTAEIKNYYGISRQNVYRYADMGLFSILRAGRTVYIEKKSFDKWLDSKDQAKEVHYGIDCAQE